jgi:DNA invertase Pin-like site-specific DNA recombinase
VKELDANQVAAAKLRSGSKPKSLSSFNPAQLASLESLSRNTSKNASTRGERTVSKSTLFGHSIFHLFALGSSNVKTLTFLDTLSHMQTPLRAGLYARVSTSEQQTLPLQMIAMQDYAQRRGWDIVAEIQDIGSGAKRRPEREKLIKLAKQRQLDVIIVWRLDRWGRSLSDLTHSLEDLRTIGVDFVSITEALDLTTPTVRAMAQMLGVFAEFERAVLRERVLAGLAHAKKNGKTLGRPASARDQSELILELSEEGLSRAEIARRLKIGRASVFRALAASNSGSLCGETHSSGAS